MKLYVVCLVVFFAFQALAEEVSESENEDSNIEKRGVAPSQPRFKKINRGLVCFQGKHNRPGHVRYYGPKRIVNGLLLVHRSGRIKCHRGNNGWSYWGCGGAHLNTVVTDRFNYKIYPTASQIIEPRSIWSQLPGAHSRHKTLFFSNVDTPFYLSQNTLLRVWYGEDLTNRYEGDNYGRVCLDVYAWFAK